MVEAAYKALATQRLKRSGVRWRHAGGLPQLADVFVSMASTRSGAIVMGVCDSDRADGGGRHDSPSYVDRTLREAVVNAVVHRDDEAARYEDEEIRHAQEARRRNL